MTKAGNSAQKRAARRVQNVLGVRYTEALRLVTASQGPKRDWAAAADAVIAQYAGDGLFSEPEDES